MTFTNRQNIRQHYCVNVPAATKYSVQFCNSSILFVDYQHVEKNVYEAKVTCSNNMCSLFFSNDPNKSFPTSDAVSSAGLRETSHKNV